MAPEGTSPALDVDILVVGAGISGIDMGCRLTQRLPELSYAVLEAREASGGTWDLFRYPGIRSDSDIYTLAFPFRPWRGRRSIVDGPSILSYLRETAGEYGVSHRIHYGQKVTRASFDSGTARWSVCARTATGEVEHRARFLYLATGYYRYDHGHVVRFPGEEEFAGPVVHPQQWPEGLDVAGRRVAVIGSGATAVTLVPALVERGAVEVTMVQRSPTYMAVLPFEDRFADAARRALSPPAAHRIIRGKNIAMSTFTYRACRAAPRLARAVLTRGVARRLPDGYAVDVHFTPSYNPWDQRLCVVPDADLFDAVRAGRARVVTGHIDSFDADGLRMRDGSHLPADVIVTATGLELLAAGGMSIIVDGNEVKVPDAYVYKGLMLSDVPNLAWCVGYTNASWTLRADLSATWACRLLRRMRAGGWDIATPRYDGDPTAQVPILDLTSGYVQRAAGVLPKAAARRPWSVRQSYLYDLATMSAGRIEDGRLELTRARGGGIPAAPRPEGAHPRGQ